MRAPTRPALLAGAAALAVAAAGCGGISDPYNDPGGGGAAAAASTATRPPITIEREGQGPSGPDDPPPRPQRIDAAALSADAAETIEAYVGLTGTWTWETVAANFRRASQLALDGARADAAMMASQIPNDPRYETEEIRQRTRIVGILQRGGGDARPRYVVLQRRRIELRDVEPSDAYVVTVAVLRRAGDGWAVSSWEDQG